MNAPLKIIVHGLQTILTDSIFAIRGLSNHPSFLPILENFSLSEILWTEFIFSDPFLQTNFHELNWKSNNGAKIDIPDQVAKHAKLIG